MRTALIQLPTIACTYMNRSSVSQLRHVTQFVERTGKDGSGARSASQRELPVRCLDMAARWARETAQAAFCGRRVDKCCTRAAFAYAAIMRDTAVAV